VWNSRMDGFDYVGVEGFQCDEKFLHTHMVKASARERNLANCRVCSIEYHVCCLHSSFCYL
jgi:hypothetical protein